VRLWHELGKVTGSVEEHRGGGSVVKSFEGAVAVGGLS